MKIGKIRPMATIVAQFAAGIEIEAISHEGKIFLPAISIKDFVGEDGGDTPTTDKGKADSAASDSPKATKSKSAAPAKGDDNEAPADYTEKELMDMDTKELMRICKEEFGIDPNEHKGKNTNKKLRDLILDAQENADNGDEGDEGTDDSASGNDDGDEGDELFDKVADLLEDYDGGKKSRKSVLATLKKLAESDDYEEADVTKIIDEFDNDSEADLDETAEKIVKVLRGERPTTKKAKKSAKKDEDDDELVEVSELKVGDRVSVWWDDDNKAWFDGEVKSIRRGKVVIAYDDDTEDAIDPEVHTKIKLIED